jgi:exodeoxyribonuclease VII small subunit
MKSNRKTLTPPLPTAIIKVLNGLIPPREIMEKEIPEKETFERALRALEEAVELLERGDLPLEEALACFERGVKSAAQCRNVLQSVDTRVENLLKDRDGALSVSEFKEE